MRINHKKSVSEIQKMMDEVELHIIKSNIEYTKVQFHELQDCFSGPAPSGDTTTLGDVLKSKWLLLHEILELSELKKKGFAIKARLLRTNPWDVEKAHLFAMEWELSLAQKAGDGEWVEKRLRNVESWIGHPRTIEPFIQAYKKLFERYSNRHP